MLGGYPEDLSAKAEKLVTKLGVEVRKGVMVTDIDEDGVTFKQGEQTGKLAAKTVLWGGGVITTEFGKKLGERTHAPTDKQGRIKVNPDLTVPGIPTFSSWGIWRRAMGRTGSRCQESRRWRCRAAHMRRKRSAAGLKGKHYLKPFHYFDKGDMAVIGRARRWRISSDFMFRAFRRGWCGCSSI